MSDNSNGVVILITLLNILVYKLRKLQEAQQTNRLPLSLRQLCRRFSLQEIRWATNNFQEELVIGKGGFGMVYKGIIDFRESHGHVAIKRLKSMSKQGSKEFQTEIEMLSKFQHSHLVSLIGYCDDCEEMILVYDYMSRGNLADHLHKRVRKGDIYFPPLSWVQRLKICIGAAHGLDYLHTGTSIENRVIHRDVKTTNILLDENLAAKIADFGLAKTGPANQTCTYVSTRVKGTLGYLDPYYVSTRRLTRKCDVYAFGVVLLEVLCGRPAVDTSLDEEQKNLARWAQHCFKEGLLDQIIDPSIKGEISYDSLYSYADLAIRCLHFQPKLRPTMAEVVVGLESALTLQEKSTHYSLVEIIPDEEVPQSSKLKLFAFNDLRIATRKFHRDNVIGKGAYGHIFKGWVDETTFAPTKWGTGLVVAVKRLNRRIKSHEMWLAEQNCLGKLCHPNVVKLIGCCLKKEHRLLVYEFMPQGSLDKHLFRTGNTYFQPLSWKIRISIALDAAKGLAYLHSPEANVIHRDFKTANILIDSNYNAKLSGFQLAKEGPEHERTHVSTDINGTVCYIAPEYVATGHLTMKSDIYGFGVVLREILTGQSVFELLRAREEGLVSWAKTCLTREPTILDVMDADIQGQYTIEAALRASALALKCLSVDPKSRPDANQVVKELEQIQDL